MDHRTKYRTCCMVLLCLSITACAGTQTLINAPTVNLFSVELAKVGLSHQTFNLGFDVDNPNTFPLPVRAVEYRIFLDDERFAGGETEGSFTVPARGQDRFVISVELDFLNTAAQLATLFRRGVPENVNYELQGSLTVDIPFTRPIPFSSTGVIAIDRGKF